MKNLSSRKGITVRSRSDGGLTVEFELGERTVSLALLIQHEGWKGNSLAVWETESKDPSRFVLPPNNDASAEDVANVLYRVLEERL